MGKCLHLTSPFPSGMVPGLDSTKCSLYEDVMGGRHGREGRRTSTENMSGVVHIVNLHIEQRIPVKRMSLFRLIVLSEIELQCQ